MKLKYPMLLVSLPVISLIITSCSFMRFQNPLPKEVYIQLIPANSHVPTVFKDLDKEISISVVSHVPGDYPTNDFSKLENKKGILKVNVPQIAYTQHITPFALEATTDYMQRMRFDVVPVGDYNLEIVINQFQTIYSDQNSATAYITLDYKLTDNAGQSVIPSTQVKVAADGSKLSWGQIYWEALNKINWDRIARYLTTKSTPKEEKNAMVTGDGDTALEQTVIRWYVTSSPQGADVTWHVVSSTPDVANTNSNYIGTTPYESTESFDIRGLTYNNAGNVQIEVSCEKPGYLTQRKRFNLRQAIDQKEISAKFNLIKDE